MSNSVFYQDEINLLIRDKQQVLYNGKVSAITTWNEKGVLDVLPQHTHFISIINKSIGLITKDGTKKNIAIDTGIIKVTEGEIRIYLGIFSSISNKTLGK